jgi:hypothetical protein
MNTALHRNHEVLLPSRLSFGGLARSPDAPSGTPPGDVSAIAGTGEGFMTGFGILDSGLRCAASGRTPFSGAVVHRVTMQKSYRRSSTSGDDLVPQVQDCQSLP